MDPINRALAFIEDELAGDLGVDEIARASFISRYHLSRVFAAATGYPPSRYVRLRRLTEAARLLRQSERSILEIALAVGYDSHAVFSRAFRAQFGVSPSDFRRDGAPTPLSLVQPMIASERMRATVQTPHERNDLSLTAVGMSRQYRVGDDMAAGHHALMMAWRARTGEIRFGERCDFIQMGRRLDEERFALFVGLTVSEVEDRVEDLERVDLSWDRYLAFPFSVEAAGIEGFVTAIYADWFPNHRHEVTPASGDHLQVYRANPEVEALDPVSPVPPALTVEGEIWVPVCSVPAGDARPHAVRPAESNEQESSWQRN